MQLDDQNLSKHRAHNGKRADSKSGPTAYTQTGHLGACFSTRFPQAAQNSFNEGGHHLLTY